MTLSLAQRRVIRSALADIDPVEEFAIENRAILDAISAMAEEYVLRKSAGVALPHELVTTELRGGPDQARVLLEIARENGLEVGIVLKVPNTDQCVVVKVPANEGDDASPGGFGEPLVR